jgi:virginiamycin B lyase
MSHLTSIDRRGKASRRFSQRSRIWVFGAAGGILACGLMLLSLHAQTVRPIPNGLQGGAHGFVHDDNGDPIEGIGVQLVSAKSAIRTTVYTNGDGRYEFPVLDQGSYTLRIALPREYQPYVKESVKIDGPAQLDTIVLNPVSKTGLLPPTPEILSQLTGSEWLMNMAGTGEEKRVFSLDCGFGCHSYQQIFRNRYDERSWRLIVQRMTRGGGGTLTGNGHPTPQTLDRADRPVLQDEDLLVKWLSAIRGPSSQDPMMAYLPRPRGAATRVVVTEYELPRDLLSPHDVSGDSKGNVWYTAFRTPYSGVLDSRTGVVKEVRIPQESKPDVVPGAHRVWVDKNGIVWMSEAWDHYLTALDPRTGQIIKHYTAPSGHAAGFGNFAMDDDGYVYFSQVGAAGVDKFDSKTGEFLQSWPFKKITRETYDSIISPDGKYWAGAPVGKNLIGLLDTKTGQLWELETGPEISSGARGGFDPQGNAWFGGRGGMLLKLDPETRRVTQYHPPEQYNTFYECLPDKNGEIWAGGLHSGHVLRFNPKTEKWISYMMPEPYSHDRRTWIDNSTNPVSVWFVVQEGYMVRVQPLE